MTENISQQNSLHEETRLIWDENAAFWDAKMSDEGNHFQRTLVHPTSLRLLQLQAQEQVLEIACGNGIFARLMAQSENVSIIATDFSGQMLEHARARSAEYSGRIEYHSLDATREEEIIALGLQRFDAVVCHQGIMDMSEIDPLMRGVRQVLKPGGRFVFSLSHPCFNQASTVFTAEEATVNGEIVETYAVKISEYLHPRPQKGIGIVGQPVAQYYFDRPLHVLFKAAFQAGLVIDGLEEPAFTETQESKRLLSWTSYREIPPVLVARLRVFRER